MVPLLKVLILCKMENGNGKLLKNYWKLLKNGKIHLIRGLALQHFWLIFGNYLVPLATSDWLSN